MKGCMVKMPGVLSLTLESMEYPGPGPLLDAFPGKTTRLSMCVALEADCWVVEGAAPCHSFLQTIAQHEPDALEIYRQLHEAVSLATVRWERYDIVVSLLPIIPDDIIQQHPDILWCYSSVSHVSKLHRRSVEKPYGAYDLFLDHCMGTGDGLGSLPQAVSFPHPIDSHLLRSLIRPAHEPYVFIGSRLATQGEEALERIREQSPLPIRWTVPPTRREFVGDRFVRKISVGDDVDKGRAFLEKLGSCKYLLLARKPGFVGQCAAEAAGLGVIVVSGPGRYTSQICHPQCLTASGDVMEGIEIIRAIEADSELQKEIIVHQDRVLQETFWRKPNELLCKALEMKRAGRSAPPKPG